MKRFLLVGVMCTVFILNGCTNSDTTEIPADVSTDIVFSTSESNVIEAVGKVKGMNVKDIYIDFPSIVEEISVREGQKVEGGDVLAILNMNNYLGDIKNRELEKDIGNLKLQDIRKSITAEQNEMVRLQNELKKKKSQLNNGDFPDLLKLGSDMENAQRQYNKVMEDLNAKQILYNLGAISKKELDVVENEAFLKEKVLNDIKLSIQSFKDAKHSEINNLETSIDYKKVQLSDSANGSVNRVGIQETSIDMLDNTINLMKSKVDKSFIDGNKIVSDIKNGLVYTVDCSNGSMTGQGGMATKLFTIMDLDSVVVEADVPEEFIKNVKVNDKVEIIPQADRMKRYNGTVKSIAGKAFLKNGETNVKVEITVNDKDDYLKPDFNVDVRIVTEKIK